MTTTESRRTPGQSAAASHPTRRTALGALAGLAAAGITPQ